MPTPAAAPDDPPLIWADALEGVGGKEETLRELAGLMLEECPRLLEQTEVDRLLDSSITSATRSWHSPDSRSDLHGAAGS